MREATAKQRVLHIIHGLTIGGAEMDLLHKSVALTRNYNYDITICCLMRRGDLADQAEKAGLRVVGPLMHHRYDVMAGLALRRLLLSKPWSLVHTHIFAANLVAGLVLATLPSRSRPPMIVSEHAMAERWSWFVPIYYRWLQRLADVILVPSQSAANDYTERGLGKQHIQVMPNALDVGRFEGVDTYNTARHMRKNLGIPQQSYLIGTVCRLEKVKGVSLLIRAIKELPVYLVVVGDGPQRPTLSALAHEVKMSERVRFLGTRADIPSLLVAFDLFVLPSYSESFGIVVAEALLAGTPVVATQVGGIPEVTDQGRYARLVSPDEQEALARAILWMMEHPTEARKQALEGKHFIRNKYSLDIVVEQQHALYRQHTHS